MVVGITNRSNYDSVGMWLGMPLNHQDIMTILAAKPRSHDPHRPWTSMIQPLVFVLYLFQIHDIHWFFNQLCTIMVSPGYQLPRCQPGRFMNPLLIQPSFVAPLSPSPGSKGLPFRCVSLGWAGRIAPRLAPLRLGKHWKTDAIAYYLW